MSTPEEQLQLLYTVLYQLRALNYVTLSCVAFLVYDILTNLDKEVHYIWRYYHNTDETRVSWRRRLRRALVQVLFIFGRYYALLYLVYFSLTTRAAGTSPVWLPLPRFMLLSYNVPVYNRQGLSIPVSDCKGFYYYTVLAGQILYTTLVNVILVMRLNVLYQIFHGIEGLQKYQFFLGTVVIELAVGISASTWIQENVVEPPAGIPWPGCIMDKKPNLALTLPGWIVASLVATTLFGLTLHLLFSSMRWRPRSLRDFTISNMREEIRNIQPATLMLIGDGVLFYIPVIMALYSFCSSRFIIHTRETVSQQAYRRQVEELSLVSLSRVHR
ncbi:hypothetical protein BKA83DRAFT_4330951 [Pisolithus microcarpus]|nr:hypothetical protein BKA83DRAFT_4330951 [Pisolithus microcarpus]